MFHVKCANPKCPEYFDTWNLRKKYHSAKCHRYVRYHRTNVPQDRPWRLPVVIPGVCDICGKVIGPRSTRSYCKRHYRAYCKKCELVPRPMSRPRICATCGVSFLPASSTSLFCKKHDTCVKRTIKRTPLEPQKCAAKDCDVVFFPMRSNHRYHSEACRVREVGKAWRRRNADRLHKRRSTIYRAHVLAKAILHLQEKGIPT